MYKYVVCNKSDISNLQGKERSFRKWCWLTPWEKKSDPYFTI